MPNIDTQPTTGLRAAAAKRARKRGVKLTLAELQADPSQIVSPLDLAEVGLVGNYQTLKNKIAAGEFPSPISGPLGGRFLKWQAGTILEFFGLLPKQEADAAI
jgi:hypothetical protein